MDFSPAANRRSTPKGYVQEKAREGSRACAELSGKEEEEGEGLGTCGEVEDAGCGLAKPFRLRLDSRHTGMGRSGMLHSEETGDGERASTGVRVQLAWSSGLSWGLCKLGGWVLPVPAPPPDDPEFHRMLDFMNSEQVLATVNICM